MHTSIRAVVMTDFSIFFFFFKTNKNQATKLQQSLREELTSKEKVSSSRVCSLITNCHFMRSVCFYRYAAHFIEMQSDVFWSNPTTTFPYKLVLPR